jgi:hypothetical protein
MNKFTPPRPTDNTIKDIWDAPDTGRENKRAFNTSSIARDGRRVNSAIPQVCGKAIFPSGLCESGNLLWVLNEDARMVGASHLFARKQVIHDLSYRR